MIWPSARCRNTAARSPGGFGRATCIAAPVHVPAAARERTTLLSSNVRPAVLPAADPRHVVRIEPGQHQRRGPLPRPGLHHQPVAVPAQPQRHLRRGSTGGDGIGHGAAVRADDAALAAHHQFRRVDIVVVPKGGVVPLPGGVGGGGIRVLPTQPVPIVDVEPERQNTGLVGQLAEQRVCRGAGGTGLRGEQLQHRARPRDDRGSAGGGHDGGKGVSTCMRHRSGPRGMRPRIPSALPITVRGLARKVT